MFHIYEYKSIAYIKPIINSHTRLYSRNKCINRWKCHHLYLEETAMIIDKTNTPDKYNYIKEFIYRSKFVQMLYGWYIDKGLFPNDVYISVSCSECIKFSNRIFYSETNSQTLTMWKIREMIGGFYEPISWADTEKFIGI